MSTKEAVLDLVKKLPDDCSLDDIQYHIYVLQTIERGRAEVAQGNIVSHEQVKQELRTEWLKNGVK
jgi:predicted transcriptional regulator